MTPSLTVCICDGSAAGDQVWVSAGGARDGNEITLTVQG